MTVDTEQETYVVELKPKDESWKRDGCFGVVVLIAVVALVPLLNGTGDLISNGINGASCLPVLSC